MRAQDGLVPMGFWLAEIFADPFEPFRLAPAGPNANELNLGGADRNREGGKSHADEKKTGAHAPKIAVPPPSRKRRMRVSSRTSRGTTSLPSLFPSIELMRFRCGGT